MQQFFEISRSSKSVHAIWPVTFWQLVAEFRFVNYEILFPMNEYLVNANRFIPLSEVSAINRDQPQKMLLTCLVALLSEDSDTARGCAAGFLVAQRHDHQNPASLRFLTSIFFFDSLDFKQISNEELLHRILT